MMQRSEIVVRFKSLIFGKSLRIYAIFLVLSGLIWVLQQEQNITLEYPLHIVDLPDSIRLVSPKDYSVRFMEVKASSISLLFSGLFSEKQPIELSLRNERFVVKSILENGFLDLRIFKNRLIQEVDASLVNSRIYPEQLHLEIDKLERRKLPVHPVLNLTIQSGYCLKEPVQSQPDSVWVKATAQQLDTISYITTLPTEVSTEYFLHETTVELEQKNGIVLETPQVLLAIKTEQITEQEFTVPITVQNKPHRRELLIEPSSATVKIVGGISIISTITEESIRIIANYNQRDTLSNIIPLTSVMDSLLWGVSHRVVPNETAYIQMQ